MRKEEQDGSIIECLQVNNINVMVRTTTKNSIEEYGDPAKFLEDNQYLLGKQVFLGELLWQLLAMQSYNTGQHRPTCKSKITTYTDLNDVGCAMTWYQTHDLTSVAQRKGSVQSSPRHST